MTTRATKTAIWFIRCLQWPFAVIITAITAYFIHQFRKTGYLSPREVVVPLIFSILAILFTTFSFIALFFLNRTLQLLSAILDFALWVGYLVSAGLLRRDYHVHGGRNDLRNKIQFARISSGYSAHRFRDSALVRLLAALVLIQLFLFFLTMLLQVWAAKKYHDIRQNNTRIVHEKGHSGIRSRFSRSSPRLSTEYATAPAVAAMGNTGPVV